MTLSQDRYPHILDTIFGFALYDSLLVLRATSRALRDRVDAELVRHIAVRIPDHSNGFIRGGRTMCDYLWSVRDEEHYRIPWTQWWESIGAAVRIVDIHTDLDPYEGTPTQLDDSRGCWCGPDPTVGLLLEILGPRLAELSLVRQWGMHQCFMHLKTPRRIAFCSPHATRELRPTCTADVNIVHFPPRYPLHRIFPTTDHPEHIWGSRVILRFPAIVDDLPDDLNSDTLNDLCNIVAAYLDRRHPCTLVIPEFWPLTRLVLMEWRLQEGARVPSLSAAWISHLTATHSPFDGVPFSGSLKFVAQHFDVMTEEAYRESVGEQMYALEEFWYPAQDPASEDEAQE